MAKKSGVVTKGQAAAREAAEKMGAVIVPAGNGGFTLMPKDSAAGKAAAERQRLIDEEKAKLAAAEPVETVVPVSEGGRPEVTKPAKKAKKSQTPDASVAAPWRGIDPATISKNPGATIAEHPDGQKFCKAHNTTHPATLEFFASNVTAKDALFNVCKLAEKEARDAKKAQAQPSTVPTLRQAKKATAQAATASAEPSNIIPLAATSAPAAKSKKRSK